MNQAMWYRCKPILENVMKIRFILLSFLFLGIYTASESSSFFPGDQQADKPKEVGATVYSKNPEANALYIQAQEYLKNGDSRAGGSMDNAHKSLKLFREATEKDPKFALAYIGQADALNWFALNVRGAVSPVAVYQQQEEAALKAIAIDDTLVDAHIHLAEIYYDNTYEWDKTEKELKRVLELSPNNISAMCRYARLFGTLGQFDKAEELAKKALAIDESKATANRALLRIYYWERKDDAAYEQAMEALKKDPEDRPTQYFLSFILYHQGKFDQGIEASKKGSFGDADSLAGLAYGYAMAGYQKKLKDALEEFKHHGG